MEQRRRWEKRMGRRKDATLEERKERVGGEGKMMGGEDRKGKDAKLEERKMMKGNVEDGTRREKDRRWEGKGWKTGGKEEDARRE